MSWTSPTTAPDILLPDDMAGDEISVEELKALVDRGTDFLLLDVREPHEHERCRIPGSVLIPLGELPRRVGELDRSRPLAVYCRSGARSARAVRLLREGGFATAVSVAGGIFAWSERIDPSIPPY